jgi:hypothetical protein
MAVTNQFQQVSGICMSDMPGRRHSITVETIFIAERSDARLKIAMLKNQSVCPSPSPGPEIAPTALSGG